MNQKKSLFEILDEVDVDEDIEASSDDDEFDYDQEEQFEIKKQVLKDQELELQTIIEVAEESQASMQRNEINYLIDDSYNIPVIILDDFEQPQKLTKFKEFIKQKQLEKQRVEQQFKQLVQEQAQFLLKQQKEEQILKKLEKTIKPSKLQLTVQELLNQQSTNETEVQNMNKKPKPQLRNTNNTNNNNNNNNNNNQILKLTQEIEQYKIKYNEDQEIIRTLKCQIKKMEIYSNNSGISTNTTRSDFVNEENEKLKQEIIQMKIQHQLEKNELKSQLQRANRVQSAIQQQKILKQPQPNDKQKEEIEKLKTEIQQQSSQFRVMQKEYQQHIDKLKKQIIDLEKQISSLKSSIETPDMQQKQIIQLKQQIELINEEKAEILNKYMLDNQILLLFPTQHKNVLVCMNFFNKMELKRKMINYFRRLFLQLMTNNFQFIKEQIRKVKYTVKFMFTRKVMDHPDNQQLLRLAIAKIRASPTILEQQVIQMNKQIQEYSYENKQITIKLNEQIQVNTDLKSYYGKLDELLKIDKIQLANNLMQRILKKEAEDRINQETQNIPELELIKQYADIIYKSTLNNVQIKQKSPEKQIIGEVKVEVKKQCSKNERHKKREERPIKGQYYNK